MGLLVLFSFALALIIAIGTLTLIHGMTHPQRRTYANALAHDQPTDPADLELAAETVEFNFDDGTMSPGWVIEGKKTNGPTVIFTHGWSDSRYGALIRVPLLAEYASRVVVYDMRGHGDSSAKRCGLSIRETQDLLAIMDRVDNGGAMMLWGSSMGAGITIAAAGAECLAVKRGEQRKRLAGVVAEGPFRFPTEAAAKHLWIRRCPPQPLAWLAAKHFAFWQGETRASFDRANHAANITTPLLIMHGSDDEICPLTSSIKIADAAPDCELVEFEGAIHENLARYDETKYRATLDSFFERVAATTTIETVDLAPTTETTSETAS